MTSVPPAPRQRSGGRSQRVRTAVGDAVLDLLARGRVDFTTAEVAQRADVSRRTLYRWWPTQDDLLAEALERHAHTVTVPDTGSWASDVARFAHDVAAFAAAPIDLSLARVMASGHHPQFATAVAEHFAEPMRNWDTLVERAVRRGEATNAHAPRTVITTLVAPLFLAPLTTGLPADPDAVDRIAALVVDATRPRG